MAMPVACAGRPGCQPCIRRDNHLSMELNGKNRVVALLRKRPQSRVELAQQTGLVKSSLTKITAQLLQDGIIAEIADPEPASDSAHMGRPKTLLQLKSGVNFSLCVYMSIESLIVYFIDQTNAVLLRDEQHWNLADETQTLTVAACVTLIQQKAAAMCQRYQIPISKLKQIAVATQGKIAQHTGIVHYSQLFRERHFNLADAITAATGVPARIVNIAYCSVYHLKKLYQDKSSFLAILLGYGMGVGIVIDHQIILGPDGTAPEISHIAYASDGPRCYCGASGCAETYLTYRAIIQKLTSLNPVFVPDATVQEQLDHIAHQLISHTQPYEQVIRDAGRVLGFVIAQIITMFDIRDIIINGEVSIFFDCFRDEIERYLAQHNDYQFGAGQALLVCEPDNDVAFKGLVELTNDTCLV